VSCKYALYDWVLYLCYAKAGYNNRKEAGMGHVRYSDRTKADYLRQGYEQSYQADAEVEYRINPPVLPGC
jgi:hypothetical protein